MLNHRRCFPAQDVRPPADIQPKRTSVEPFRLKGCRQTIFSTAFPSRSSPRVRLGRRSFQKLKEALRHPQLFGAKPALICALHKILDLYCALHYTAAASGAATSRQLSCTPVREGIPMIKVEDIQSYGK